NLGEQLSKLPRVEAVGQTIRKRTLVLAEHGRVDVPQIKLRNIAQHRAEDALEIGKSAAGRIDHDVARLARDVGEDMDKRGFADAAFAIDHDVAALFLQNLDEPGQDREPA